MSSERSARPVWAAERAVGCEDVGLLLERAGLDAGPLTLVGEGFDNFVFSAGDLWVRLARRAVAAPDIRKELRLLPTLNDLGLDVPLPVYVPDDIETAPWPWFAFRPVVGRELGDALLDGTDLTETARRLGAFLRALHHPSRANAVRGFVRGDTFRRADIPYRRTHARASLQWLGERLSAAEVGALHGALDEADGIDGLPAATLVHGDLHFRHVLVDGAGLVVGVIDWGDAHLGHPACDLHALWRFEPAERVAFLQSYGEVDPVTLRASRVVAISIDAVLALSAGDFGLPRAEAAAVEALRRACVV